MLQEIAAAAVAEEGGASQVAASWGQGSEDVSASWEGGAAASLEGGAGMDGQDVIGQRLVGIGEEEAALQAELEAEIAGEEAGSAAAPRLEELPRAYEEETAAAEEEGDWALGDKNLRNLIDNLEVIGPQS